MGAGANIDLFLVYMKKCMKFLSHWKIECFVVVVIIFRFLDTGVEWKCSLGPSPSFSLAVHALLNLDDVPRNISQVQDFLEGNFVLLV